jgi:hypothetical protein
MNRVVLVAAGLTLLGSANVSYAADHLFTAIAAGGLTTSSQPFMNGSNNPGRSGEDVPGQGSPLSGMDHTVPATDVHPEATRIPPAVSMLKTAPSVNSGKTTTVP